MRNVTRYISMAIGGAALALILAACGQTTEYTTETKTVTVSSEDVDGISGGQDHTVYQEELVEVPGDALDDAIEVESVTFNYEITNETAAGISARGYAANKRSADTTEEPTDDPDYEKLLDVTVAAGASESGSTESDTIEDVVNDQEESFVVGSAITLDPADIDEGDTVTIEVSATIEASLGLGGM